MAEWPGGLTVYDIRAEAMTPLAETGASLADSVADVAAADIITSPCSNDAQVREVVGELAAHAKPGTVIAIHSTISDTTAVELAERAQTAGHPRRRRAGQRWRGGRGERRAGDHGGRRPRGLRADQAGVQTVGVGGHPCRRAGRGHPNEVGPQHVDVHLLRRGMRGHEAGRGGRAGPAGRSDGWCVTPTR